MDMHNKSRTYVNWFHECKEALQLRPHRPDPPSIHTQAATRQYVKFSLLKTERHSNDSYQLLCCVETSDLLSLLS
jgi:hypothetical protein